MANTYVAPNFNVDTNTNIAGLETLKGSAIASTDNIYVFNGATLTVEKSFVALNLYINDNSAANAATKTGYIVSTTGGITIRLYTTTLNTGLDGKLGTGNGYYDLRGSAGNVIEIISNTANICSNHNVRQCPNVFKFCKFTNWYVLSMLHAGFIIEDCESNGNSLFGYIFYALPSSFLRNSIKDYAAGCNVFYCNIAVAKATLQGFYANLALVRSSSQDTLTYLRTTVPIGTTYLQFELPTTAPADQLTRIDQMVQILSAELL